MTLPADRLRVVLARLVAAAGQVLTEEEVSSAELFAALEALNEVGAAGEMVLLADVLGISTSVERRESAGVPGTPGNVQGPFWRPCAPRYVTPADLVRDGEPGERLVISGTVTDAQNGRPLPGAEIDLWQTDAAGRYDHEDPGLPEWNMRGVVVADDNGHYEVRLVRPQPYQVPTSGPVGRLLQSIGQHPWRPAHTHLKASAAGYRELTTMLYYAGDRWLGEDTIDSVKPELVFDPKRGVSGDWEVTCDIALRSR